MYKPRDTVRVELQVRPKHLAPGRARAAGRTGGGGPGRGGVRPPARRAQGLRPLPGILLPRRTRSQQLQPADAAGRPGKTGPEGGEPRRRRRPRSQHALAVQVRHLLESVACARCRWQGGHRICRARQPHRLEGPGHGGQPGGPHGAWRGGIQGQPGDGNPPGPAQSVAGGRYLFRRFHPHEPHRSAANTERRLHRPGTGQRRGRRRDGALHPRADPRPLPAGDALFPVAGHGTGDHFADHNRRRCDRPGRPDPKPPGRRTAHQEVVGQLRDGRRRHRHRELSCSPRIWARKAANCPCCSRRR